MQVRLSQIQKEWITVTKVGFIPIGPEWIIFVDEEFIKYRI